MLGRRSSPLDEVLLERGAYLDYAAHVVCNCPLLAAAALHGALLHQSLFWAIIAFATVVPALWAYYFKLIIPALAGREARLDYSGDDLVPNRALADAIRRVRLFVLDPILPPMVVIVLVILSHGWEATWGIAAIYGLLCSLSLSVMHFTVGFTKAERIDSGAPVTPGIGPDLPPA